MKNQFQKIISYNGCIPSKDLNEYQYQTYLKVATPYELEKDIITEKTMLKVNDE
jgi:hypothetical protein